MKYSKIFLFLSLTVLAACSTEDNSEDTTGGTESFDRGAMLANWADNIIIPAFASFDASTTNLEAAATAFVEDPSTGNFSALRAQYAASYKDFQTVSMFEIGKAEEINYRNYLNTYPVNTSSLENNISSGTYNLSLPSTYTQQGFPALDYLLYGLGATAQENLAYYTGDDAAKYKAYLLAVTERINALTAEVNTAWQGEFRDSFVNNTSSSSTGSVDRFTNDFVMYFEKYLRSGKIGYPAGAFTGSPSPENTEAYYAGDLSKELYLTALNSVIDFFNGKHFNGSQTGKSYKQYLDYMDSMKDGTDLSLLIQDQFSIIKTESSKLDNSFKSQIQTNNTAMLATFDELQKAVVLMKVDMMQALSINVDYVDSDGD